ncbi:ATP synthase F0 subcomplex B subunit [Chthonomonas calidirosea]|uniref:ATP synthase subunit b n=1 Tax=Chthonomonas calidirosea (strain DSM 23976 / ICMP 18418 / T49) TaxID=1303518 RepID=S0EX41_CHTCT|nr:ATP synthase F0 subunit B [Chthonomonas calidirosea]CCW34348.1 ATP synthase F0 subcomplex B subunit [Chthonomonas calidirosea T49]CEK13846.1 ATP synthase F0 subcomplex B subunit [Chthonomonas calidirosea]CEK15031.1 ATP synthase F0 subcomplex B subunit [Chthonomonas calidirosea]
MLQIEQAIKFNPVYFGIQILIFLLLLQILTRVFWRPFLKDMEKRTEDIEARYRRREELQQEMERLRAEYQQRIAVVDAEARAHIQEAVKKAQGERERLIKEARTQAEQVLLQGRQSIEREREATLQALKEQMIAMATDVADHALGSLYPKEELRRSIEARVAQATTTASSTHEW